MADAVPAPGPGSTAALQAEEALSLLLESERTGVYREPDLPVRAYLLQWLATRERRLQPTTRGSLAPQRSELLD